MKKRLLFIITAFTLSFLTMAALGLVSTRRFSTLLQAIDKVEQSHNILAQLNLLEVTIKDIDRFERGYIITRDSNYLRLLEEPCRRLLPLTEKLKQMTADNSDQYRNVIWIRSYVVSRLDDLKQSLGFADTTLNTVPVHFYEGRVSMRQCMDFIQKMKRTELELLERQHENKQRYQRLTSSTFRYLFFGFGGLTLLLFFLMVQEFIRRFRYQEELQAKLIDLRQSHNDLEQIAFAASHHLREPLRKMQVFINRLQWLKKDADQESRELMERITHASGRMQELIEDLANLTNLVSEQGQPETTDLDQIFEDVVKDMQEKIVEKKATIQRDRLPVIQGYPEQVQLLFKALLDNSLKFSREDVFPEIHIKSDRISGDELTGIDKRLSGQIFYRITISDNGIGFNNKFMHKMFLLFQRLHTQHSIYEGKGTGLAISQRVMANHHGYILAHGRPGVGASFKLFFPA
jgi:signal transduction histidine kinase